MRLSRLSNSQLRWLLRDGEIRFSDVDSEIINYKKKLNRLIIDTRKSFIKSMDDFFKKWESLDRTLSTQAAKQLADFDNRLEKDEFEGTKGYKILIDALLNMIFKTKQ